MSSPPAVKGSSNYTRHVLYEPPPHPYTLIMLEEKEESERFRKFSFLSIPGPVVGKVTE